MKSSSEAKNRSLSTKLVLLHGTASAQILVGLNGAQEDILLPLIPEHAKEGGRDLGLISGSITHSLNYLGQVAHAVFAAK